MTENCLTLKVLATNMELRPRKRTPLYEYSQYLNILKITKYSIVYITCRQ